MLVSGFTLDGGEFGVVDRLLDVLRRAVHGGELGNACYGEVASFVCFPLFALLDQDRSGEAQQACGVRESADGGGLVFDVSLFARSSGLVE